MSVCACVCNVMECVWTDGKSTKIPAGLACSHSKCNGKCSGIPFYIGDEVSFCSDLL